MSDTEKVKIRNRSHSSSSVGERKSSLKSKKKRRSYRRSSSSDSDSSASSSSRGRERRKRHRSSDSAKRKKKKHHSKEKKRHKERKHKKHKKKKDSDAARLADAQLGPAAPKKPGPEETPARVLKPMTKEDWDKQQSVVRRVYDPETGRNRLIKGDGEVLEEIVSRKQHQEINKKATTGDGLFYSSQMGTLKPS